MRVKAMFSVIPIGAGLSLSRYIAACERVLEEAGLERELHAHGTNVEGEWDDVMAALKRCHERVHALGAERIATLVKLGTRTDKDQSMRDMVLSVQEKIPTA